MTNVTIDCHSINLTEEQFFQLCIDNRNLKFERNKKGDLIILSPTGGETSNRNFKLIQQLGKWTDQDQTGIAFDSSGGFKLPNGAERSPDASWIPLVKWESLTSQQKKRFLPFAPDFLVELLSPSDNLENTQRKMLEYIENGTKLGWLINRKTRQVEIYRQGKEVEIIDNPSTISGENILVGFVLDLSKIW